MSACVTPLPPCSTFRSTSASAYACGASSRGALCGAASASGTMPLPSPCWRSPRCPQWGRGVHSYMARMGGPWGCVARMPAALCLPYALPVPPYALPAALYLPYALCPAHPPGACPMPCSPPWCQPRVNPTLGLDESRSCSPGAARLPARRVSPGPRTPSAGPGGVWAPWGQGWGHNGSTHGVEWGHADKCSIENGPPCS